MSTRHLQRQLRLLAPKAPVLQLEHNIWDEQDTDAPTAATTNVKPQRPATSQSYIPCVPSSNNFKSSPLPPPGSTVSCLERKQYGVATPCTNIPSDPEVTLLSRTRVVSHMHGLSIQYPPNGNSQHRQTTQNRQGQDYWIPTLDAPEVPVWTAVTQPTVGVHPNQEPQPDVNRHMSTQILLPIHLVHHLPLPQIPQHLPCVNCPEAWCFHLESIMLSDPQGKGIHNIKRSYRDLRQHIHEAHLWQYGTVCTLCEDLFCYHGGKLLLLEVAEGDFAGLKLDLGRSFMTLREHVQEMHGGC